jgi:hypothetical protein
MTESSELYSLWKSTKYKTAKLPDGSRAVSYLPLVNLLSYFIKGLNIEIHGFPYSCFTGTWLFHPEFNTTLN